MNDLRVSTSPPATPPQELAQDIQPDQVGALPNSAKERIASIGRLVRLVRRYPLSFAALVLLASPRSRYSWGIHRRSKPSPVATALSSKRKLVPSMSPR